MSAAAQASLDSVIHNLILTKYTYVAATTLLVWDILLTFEQEITRVWLTRKSLGKTLFLINRYVAPILFTFDLTYQLQPSPSLTLYELFAYSSTISSFLILFSSCKRAFLPSSLLGILALTIVQFVLVMRTYAIYQSKFFLVALSCLCFISGTTMISVTVYMDAKIMTWVPAGTIPLVPGCLSECTHPLCRTLLTAFWIPFFVLETIIFLLTVYKSFSTFREIGIKHSSTLVTIVYRDGLIYYVVIMLISIANLVVWVAAPISLVYIATSLMRCLQVTIVSRLLLNIRGMLEPEFVQATQLSSLAFRPGAAPHPNTEY